MAPYSKSRIGGYFYFSSNPVTIISNNAPIYVEYRTLRHVVTSAAKCETAVVFYNAQNIIHIRYILQQLGHSQSPTPIIIIISLQKLLSKII